MRVGIWVILVLGAWLILAPAVIPYRDAPRAIASDVISGILIVAFSMASAAGVRPRVATALGTVLVGIWVAIAPIVLGYYRQVSSGANASMNDFVVGTLVVLFGIIYVIAVRRDLRMREM